MTFAIAILNYNGSILLKRFIPDIIKNCEGARIYLIDNNSSDLSVSFLKKNYSQVSVIQLDSNYGYARGYNLGLKKINEDVVVFLNNDAVFKDKESFTELCKTFISNKSISIAQPRILDYNNKDKYEYAGASGGYLDLLCYPFCRGRIINKIESSEKYKTTREIFWASGSCFAIRKVIFNELNGFDGDFFCHMEEIDLCWRLKHIKPNHKIITLGKSTVYHIGGGTMQYDSTKKSYLNFRNSIMMMIKNLPQSYIIPVLFLRFISDIIIMLYHLVFLKFKLSFTIISAYFYNIINFKRNFSKRSHMKKYKYYYYCRSILLEYYFFQKKSFSSLK